MSNERKSVYQTTRIPSVRLTPYVPWSQERLEEYKGQLAAEYEAKFRRQFQQQFDDVKQQMDVELKRQVDLQTTELQTRLRNAQRQMNRDEDEIKALVLRSNHCEEASRYEISRSDQLERQLRDIANQYDRKASLDEQSIARLQDSVQRLTNESLYFQKFVPQEAVYNYTVLGVEQAVPPPSPSPTWFDAIQRSQRRGGF